MLDRLLEISAEGDARLGITIAKLRGIVAAARRIELTDEETYRSDLAELVGRTLQLYSANRSEVDAALTGLPRFIHGGDESTCWERAKRAAQFDSPLQVVELLSQLSEIAVELGEYKRAAVLLRILERRLGEAELDSGLIKETLVGAVGVRQGLVFYAWFHNAVDATFEGRPIEAKADERLRDSIKWLELPPSSVTQRLDDIAPADILGFEVEDLLSCAFFALAELNELVMNAPTLTEIRAMRSNLRKADLWARRLSSRERWRFEDQMKELNDTLGKQEEAALKRKERQMGKRSSAAEDQDQDLDDAWDAESREGQNGFPPSGPPAGGSGDDLDSE
jgi:hypothetical protein